MIFIDGTNQMPAAKQAGAYYTVGKALSFDGTSIIVKDSTQVVIVLQGGEISTDKVSPQNVNTTIKITTAAAIGGQGHPGAPFAWTTSGYGLLVDSDGGYVNIADTSLSYTGISKRNTEYFVMVGTPTEVMEAEAQISGTSPMFPKWATGFTNTQWGWPNTGTTVKQVNFAKAGLRSWWWNQSIPSFDSGIVGAWNDECDSDNGFTNFDNMNMQRSYYDGQTAYTSEKRVWSMNRTYYAGAQRYGYALWSGDIGSGFQNMKSQKDRLIASVNLGEAKWGMDTGGFNGTPGNENYARWMEFSAFVPVFRIHGQKVPSVTKDRYPWSYGDVAAAAVKDVMHLRYQLIPYIYKYDQQASETGVGLVKSLMMAYPNDPNTKTNTDAWMFGDSLLVSPVLDQGQTTKSIYLPEGNWIDYFKGTKYTGGKTIQYAIDSTTWKDVPLFIKQGAIIPSQDYENYVGEKKMTNIYVDVFPDASTTSFDYYDDDGNSTTYKDGNYFKQKLTISRNSDWKSLDFTTGLKEGTYTPDVQNYIVKLHSKSTGAVTVAGKELSLYNNLDSLKNATGEGYATGTDIYGDVIYVKVAAGQLKIINAQCVLPAQPAQTATVYAKNTESSATFQYSVDAGATWSASQAMTQSDKSGYLKTTFTYSLTNSDNVKVRYQDSTGAIVAGNPKWSNLTTIYYKGYAAPYIHYRVGTGTWTIAPGAAMTPTTELEGYTHKIIIDLGNATTVTTCFNNGSGTWDSANGANYTFNIGTYSYASGKITKIADPVKTLGIDSFIASIASPQNVGTAITLYTASSGSAGILQTKFTVNDGVTTTTLKDYSTDTNVVWRELKAGTYTITTSVKDTTGTEVSKSLTYVVKDLVVEPTINSFTTSVATPQVIGTAILLNTTSSGGTGTLQTKFTVNDVTTITTTTLKDYSTESQSVWIPANAGTYIVTALVKDTNGKEVSKSLTYVVKDLVVDPTIDSFTTSVASPQNVGTAITLNTTSSGAAGNLQTKFTVNDGTINTTLKDYSTDTNVVWTAVKSGTYTITTSVKDTAGKEVTKTLSYVVNDLVVEPTINSFTTSVATPQVIGTAILLNATSNGGTGTLQTKFTVNDVTTITTATLKDYSTESQVVWTEAKAGTYIITAFVKDTNGKEVSKSITYVINDTIAKNQTTIYYKGYVAPYIHYRAGTGSWTTAPGVAMTPTTEMVGYTHKITIDLGTATTLTACFNNGSGTWDSNNGANYTFNAGTYVYVSGKITKIADPVKTFGIDSFEANIVSPQLVGTAITLTTTSSNAAGTVQTKFTVNDGVATTILKDYSTDTDVVWIQAKSGTYTLTTYVKDTTGTEITKSISYVIKDIVVEPTTINSFTTSVATPQLVEAAITLNTTSSGGIGTLQTKFTVNDGTTTTTVKDYSTATNTTWTPAKAGTYTITTSVKDITGTEVTKSITYVISDTIAKNQTTIYYKGYVAPYIHYRVGTGSWTIAPGMVMTPTTEMVGYTHKITINLGTTTTLTACFNNGSGTWDSKNGANYTFNVGKYTYSNGSIVLIN